jgi:RHS repeat-associated protein
LTDAWAYGLPDGSGTQRQLVDPAGEITLAASYTPWGDALSVSGEGNFTYGYFGGVMDTATGLLYVGNGQYYDPSTGRFLNRSVNPDSANPYVPWSGEPTGALIGPLVLLAMVYNRKKRREKIDVFIILFVLCLAIGMSLAACGPGTTPGEPSPTTEPQSTQSNQDNNAPTQPPVSGTPGGETDKDSNPANPGSGVDKPSDDETIECTVTPTPTTTPPPPTSTSVYTFLGNYNLSAYFTPHESQFASGNSNPMASLNGITANKYFLFSKEGICYEGLGKLADNRGRPGYDGKYISCTKQQLNWPDVANDGIYHMPPITDIAKYEKSLDLYQVENGGLEPGKYIAFDTIAVNSSIPSKGSIIYLPGFIEYLATTPQYPDFKSLLVGKGLDLKSLDIFVGEQGQYQSGDTFHNAQLQAAIAIYPIDQQPVYMVH